MDALRSFHIYIQSFHEAPSLCDPSDLIDELLKGNVPANNIEVVMFDKAQEQLWRIYLPNLKEAHPRKGTDTIRVLTDDSAQGDNISAVIVDANDSEILGFMRMPVQINVALTCAKEWAIYHC